MAGGGESLPVTSNDEDVVSERELGPGEVMCHFLHSQEPPFSTYIHTVTLQSAAKIRDVDVEKSLEVLVKCQPLLRCRITEENVEGGDKKYFFRQMELGVKNIVIHSKTIGLKEEWLSEAEKLMLQYFPSSGPLWELKLLHVNEGDADVGKPFLCVCIFLMHHIMVDAKGMADVIQNQFLPILKRVIQGEDCESDTAKVHSIMPPSEVACFKDTSIQHVPWYMKLLLKVARFRGRVLKLDERPPKISLSSYELQLPDDGLQMGTRVVAHIVDRDLLSKVRSAGKEHGVSVTSSLTVATALAIELLREEHGRPTGDTYTIHLPVDMRRFNPALISSPMPLGCYVGGFMPKLKPNVKNYNSQMFWSLCKKVQQQITKDMANLKASKAPNKFSSLLLHLLATHSEEDPVWKKIGELGMSFHFGLSNVGSCEQLEAWEDDVLSAREQYFMAAVANVKMNALFICVLTMNGNMHLLAGYNPLWLDKGFITGMFKKLDDIYTDVSCG